MALLHAVSHPMGWCNYLSSIVCPCAPVLRLLYSLVFFFFAGRARRSDNGSGQRASGEGKFRECWKADRSPRAACQCSCFVFLFIRALFLCFCIHRPRQTQRSLLRLTSQWRGLVPRVLENSPKSQGRL